MNYLDHLNSTVDTLADEAMKDPRAQAALLGFKGDLRELIVELIETVRDVAGQTAYAEAR